MGGPSSVCNTSVRVKGLCHVDTGAGNQFTELDHLAHLFERKDLILLVTVDCETGRVVPSVFQAGEACKKGRSAVWSWQFTGATHTIHKRVNDILSVLLDEVVDISENATIPI